MYSFNIKGFLITHYIAYKKSVYWRGKWISCRIGFRFVFDKNNEFQSRTAMDQRVNIINVASTQIQIYSLDGPTYSGGFKLKKHGKIVGRLTCLSSLGKNTWSMIKKKRRKNSVSVSKLNKNIIKNGEHYLFQVQRVQWKNTLTLTK